MTFKQDIRDKILTDFKDSADKASSILLDAISRVDYLGTDRVIRCIIFLSQGDLDKLRKYIDTAVNDTRDVMLWAEYNKFEFGSKTKRIRDFNKTFDKSEINVTE